MATVPMFAVVLKPWLSWRGVFAVAGGAVLIVTLIFQLFVKVGRERGEPPTIGNIFPLLKLPSFWILMLFLGFALGSVQGIYMMIPTFMISEVGFSPVFTNMVFGISRFVPVIALLTAGLILDKIGIRRTIFAVMGLSGLSIVFLGLFSGRWLTLTIFFQPAIGALAVPAVLSALSSIGPPGSRNVALSMTLPIASFIASGGVPAFVGFMGDAVSFSFGFILIGLFMIFLACLTPFLRLNIAD
ncbi:MAG: MFS transporter [Spirochaetia bacterium]|nr:MFS transporter [Spirochaetia bacterium]